MPLRWSWIHWWEANRSLYLNPTSQAASSQDMDGQGFADLRTEAIDALIAMLQDPAPEPRAAAALALGRLRASDKPAALKGLTQVVLEDEEEYVRARALLAIGMIGGEPSENFLLEYEPPSLTLRAYALLSMGLLPEIGYRTHTGLNNQLNSNNPSTVMAAWWALSRHPDKNHAAAARQLIRSAPSPWLASNALHSLGEAQSQQNDNLLAHVLLGESKPMNVRSWDLLTDVASKKPLVREANIFDGVDPTKPRSRNLEIPPLEIWYDQHERVFNLDPTPVPLGERPLNHRRTKAVTGIEAIYKSRLRSSAAIAMAGALDKERAVDWLIRLVQERDTKYNAAPKCFALISLAQIGTPRCLEALLLVATDKDGRRIKPQKALDSPMRGFAMIALGLYSRSLVTDQGPYNRPEYEQALRMLQERLSDDREKLEVRAAAAVALGLSGRTANLKLLISGYEAFDDTNPLLGGYVLLGRALLGDRNVIDPARAALERKPHHDKTTDVLARRAAVLAMGAAGTNEAIPHLIWAWDQPYYVNREVILALSLCEAPGVAVHLLPRMSADVGRFERAFMAEAVGRLLNQDTLPPMSVFLIGSNFTMKNGLLNPVRSLENEFMYQYLIPQFPEVWY